MDIDSVLGGKLDQCRMVVEETLDTYATDRIIIAWSGGKDSTLLLKLIRDVCRARNLATPRVLDIDQGDAFPEILDFRARLVEAWQLDLVVVRNDDILDRVARIGDHVAIAGLNPINQEAIRRTGHKDSHFDWVPSSPLCSQLMKSVPVLQFLAANSIQAMFTGIRWDEHVARGNETYFSPRTMPPHTRVHPLLHLTERDIWDLTFALNVPFNPMYAQGYRSLDTRTGSRKSAGRPAWEQDLERTAERGGRDADKEKMMAELRAWGYM